MSTEEIEELVRPPIPKDKDKPSILIAYITDTDGKRVPLFEEEAVAILLSKE